MNGPSGTGLTNRPGLPRVSRRRPQAGQVGRRRPRPALPPGVHTELHRLLSREPHSRDDGRRPVRGDHGGRVRPYRSRLPGSPRPRSEPSHSAGARGSPEPPVPARSRPGGLRALPRRRERGDRWTSSDDVRHLGASGARSELLAFRGRERLAGHPAGCSGRRVAAGLWPGRPLAGTARPASSHSPFSSRSAAVFGTDARRLSGARLPLHLQLLLGDQNRRASRSPPRSRASRRPLPRACGSSCSRRTTSTSIPRSASSSKP